MIQELPQPPLTEETTTSNEPQKAGHVPHYTWSADEDFTIKGGAIQLIFQILQPEVERAMNTMRVMSILEQVLAQGIATGKVTDTNAPKE